MNLGLYECTSTLNSIADKVRDALHTVVDYLEVGGGGEGFEEACEPTELDDLVGAGYRP